LICLAKQILVSFKENYRQKFSAVWYKPQASNDQPWSKLTMLHRCQYI
jgi:hypothetical protein